ncbi:MAG: hypothetical protein N2439_06410, partial [Anaerolineae bacterium]|nr:hypothetical protein [Anaerolineae bacterium]
DEEGRWTPAAFAEVAEWLAQQLNFELPPPEGGQKAEAIADPPPPRKARPPRDGSFVELARGTSKIAIRRGEISWWLEPAAPYASVEGLMVFVTPLEAPGRRMVHYRVNVKRASSQKGPAWQDVALELLDIGDQRLVLRFTADHFAASEAERSR